MSEFKKLNDYIFRFNMDNRMNKKKVTEDDEEYIDEGDSGDDDDEYIDEYDDSDEEYLNEGCLNDSTYEEDKGVSEEKIIEEDIDILENDVARHLLIEKDSPIFEKEPFVFIEISKDSHIKYEYNSDKKGLVCDRVLHTPFKYSFNYGFIPDTLSSDGDPIDAVVLMNDSLVPGCYIQCRFLGYLETSDSEGDDPKIIMCPVSSVDPTYSDIQSISDLDDLTVSKIKYFFQHYKDLENKAVVVGEFFNAEKAFEEYKKACIRYVLGVLGK